MSAYRLTSCGFVADQRVGVESGGFLDKASIKPLALGNRPGGVALAKPAAPRHPSGYDRGDRSEGRAAERGESGKINRVHAIIPHLSRRGTGAILLS